MLWVNQDESDLIGRGSQQDRAEHRVDGARLTCAGRAGDQQVRHPREVGGYRAASYILAEEDGQRTGIGRQLLEDITERDLKPCPVRNLNTDCLLAWNWGKDADIGRGQRVSEIVLQSTNLVHLDARSKA